MQNRGKALERHKVKDTLKKARAQFPDGRQNVIIMRISLDLLSKSEDLNRQLDNVHGACEDFLRGTEQIEGVIVFLHWIFPGKYHFRPKIMYMPVWKANGDDTPLQGLFGEVEKRPKDPHWVFLQEVLDPLHMVVAALRTWHLENY